MFALRSNLIIGMTTYHNEYLELSIPVLGRLKQKFILVIHNDNPAVKITKRYIRKLGYTGKLYFINSAHNVGLLKSRLAILNLIKQKKLHKDWFLFINDDDFLLDAIVPRVSEKNFAIIQNMCLIKNRLIDVLRVSSRKALCDIDNENTVIVQPHISITGTIVRTKYMLLAGELLSSIEEKLYDIDAGLSFMPPTDLIMWNAVNQIAKSIDSDSTPIYMDSVNYVATDIDRTDNRYDIPRRPSKNATTQIERALAKYSAVISAALENNAKN
ncbi:MAG: hypothetical protein IKZ34_01975 [Alphaproteobacteria bacterium]|nr:hypothetical protein [Alphaproteobacteria bacterium]